MSHNPLLTVKEYGQCVWLDNLHRRMLEDGELRRLIDEDGVDGLTSNPAIFKKAIVDSDAYDAAVAELAHLGESAAGICRELTVEDVRRAADLFRPLYDGSRGAHGFVSLEVNPHLAHDAAGTVAEAKELWTALGRPNCFIKVPATREGLVAIRTLIAAGINVNVTLLFGLERYRETTEAYLSGLADRVARGLPVAGITSVASFFLSRIDTLVDGRLDAIVARGGASAVKARALRGEAAIASARLAYRIFQHTFAPDAFGELSVHGARAQRVLWASTSTKDPSYSDVKYVEELIGRETINTMPRKTLDAYRDHGDPLPRIQDDVDRAERALAELARLGIDMDEVAQTLEDEGVAKFDRPYDELMRSLERRRVEARVGRLDPQELRLGEHRAVAEAAAADLARRDAAVKLWRRDPTLWSDDPAVAGVVANALGWLDVVDVMSGELDELEDFARRAREDGFTHVVHAGMGGSSMTPLTLGRACDRADGFPELTVLDTTDPHTANRLLENLPLTRTLVVLASKSGTTLETRTHGDLFLAAVREAAGERAGHSFVAITDPDTPLAQLADQTGFRATFENPADIGGRFSALSYFGLVPAALAGIDVRGLLERAGRMIEACGPTTPAALSPALELGAALGGLARAGRDKVTFVTPPRLAGLGLWLEQLLAESTGKQGTGLVPVAGEPLGPSEVYGNDRVFVRFSLGDAPDAAVDAALAALSDAGHPVIEIALADALDLGQEFFRWEAAVAFAGAVLGIDPFDQPNVQESKENTARLLERGVDEPDPTLAADGLAYHAVHPAADAASLLARFAGAVEPGGYLALQAYLPIDAPDVERGLEDLRALLRDRLRVAVALGYGPRYLHSTGQLHKGGPEGGTFLQLTAAAGEDRAVPGRDPTLGELERAQARGDLEALRRRGRRVLRVDLGADPVAGLDALRRLFDAALPAERLMQEGA